METAYQKVKRWRLANPDRWKEIRRSYNKRRIETIRKRRKKYKDENRDKIKRARIEHKNKITSFLDEYKASMGCCVCGENVPPALDFHHLRDKEETIALLRNRSWGIQRIMGEIEKCVVLCANCHRKLHAGLISLD